MVYTFFDHPIHKCIQFSVSSIVHPYFISNVELVDSTIGTEHKLKLELFII